MIDAVTPESGPEGTVVTILGENFGPPVGAVQGTSGVSFNGVWSTPRSWSDNSITVAVPPGAGTGEVLVTVSSRQSAGVEFAVTGAGGSGPAIGTVSPGLGTEGTVVTIRGARFGSAAEMGGVSFNGVWASVASWSEEEIRVRVPADATTGPVVVTANGVESDGAVFTVVESGLGEPAIDFLSAASGPEGMVVTIEGENFGPSMGTYDGTSGVSFNGMWGQPSSWSETVIQVPVPAGAPSGLVTVTVGGEGSNGLGFVVERAGPVIEAVEAVSGPEGARVEIRGRNFGPAMEAVQGWSGVSIDGVWEVPAYWSDREVHVAVPAGVSGGLVVIASAGQESNGVPFSVRKAKGMPPAPVVFASSVAPRAAPTLKSLYPDRGPVGETVRIKGKNYGASRGTSTVTFNGTPVTDYVSWRDKKIVVEVPEGATTGEVVVTVNGVASPTVEFTVTSAPVPSVGSLDPVSGPEGTSVEITGVNFGAVQGTGTVTFNGVAATATSWSDTSITAAVPMGATTGEVVVTVDGTSSAGVSFTVAPAISGLSPVAGPEGAAVEITGTSFGAVRGTSTVTFNGTQAATADSWSDTSITVTVPGGATTGQVVVTVNSQASNGVSFTVTPAIVSLSPVAGPEGATVEITGTSFGAVQGTSTVTFNGTAATPTEWSATSITVTVPEGATTGEVVVTVNGEASNGVFFTVGTDPIVTSLSPALGQVETTVVIGGANFGASQETSTVTFNGVPVATYAGWSATSITVTVPAGARTGPVVVTVGGDASNQVIFTVTGPAPEIRRLKPEEGEVGDSVRIKGEYFGTAQGRSTVTFNGLEASARKWNDGKIVASVPAGALTGPVVVTVEGQASNPVTFTVTGSSPSIISLDPASGEAGTPVTITGVHFGAAKGESTVTFNGVAATPTSWSDTSITAPVPAAAATGKVYVTVGGQASNGETFTVTLPAPSITGLDPTQGRVGASVTINGENFGAVQETSTVTFNGTPVETYTSWSATSITAPVPAGAATGPVLVTVGGQVSNGMVFTVANVPAISSLDPDKGAEGASVEITGTSFGATQGTSTVSFNGTAVTPTSWSDTSITVAVPAGATTGNVVVTVGSQASNGVSFTVTPAISSLSPDTGPVGTTVEITGTSFGAAQGTSTVAFNGTAVTPTSWSDTSITVTVPAGATTGDVVVTVDGEASNGVTFTESENRAPETEDQIPAQTVDKGSSAELTVSGYFSDPDGDALTYTAVSSDEAKVTVAVSEAVVTLTGVAKGEATVTVTASDGSLTAEQAFTVTVPNRAPVAEGTIPAQTVNKDASPELTVSSYFSDPDGDALTYTVVSSDEAKVTVAVDGAVVTLTGVVRGEVTVTVTAGDGSLTAEQAFTVTVPNSAPVCSNIPEQILWVNDDLRVNLSTYCSDPDGDSLTYTASSSATSKVTESVSGSTLTLTGRALGSSTITVTATDNPGDSQDSLSTTETFTAKVKMKPSCDLSSIGNQAIFMGDSERISLSSACNGTYSASSDDTTVARVSVSGSTLTITGVAVGTARVTVRVTKSGYKDDSETFTVRVTMKPSCDLSSIGDQTIIVGNSKTVSLSSVCNGTYSASSDDTTVARVSVSGSTLTITGVAVGTARVTVRVTKSGYKDDSETFTVTAKEQPLCNLSSIPDQELYVGDSRTLSLTVNCFFSANSDDTNVAMVSANNSTDELTITGVAAGTARVEVTASDLGRVSASETFLVTVKEKPSCDLSSIGPQTVNVDQSKTLSLSSVCDGTYSAESSATSKVTVSVSGNTLTITGESAGTAEVKVTVTKNGYQDDSGTFTVTVNQPTPSTPSITLISPSLQRPDDPVTIYGNHFGGSSGSVSFGGHSISIFSGQGYSWSNTSISLLIPGSLGAGEVSVTVTTSGGSTSNSYSYTVTGGPVSRGDCEEGDEDCEDGKKDKESGDSDEGGTDEDSAEGGG